MSHIPYGYKIVNAQAEIDEPKAKQVRQMFEAFLSGSSLYSLSKITGIKTTSAQMKRMLVNTVYLGDGYYPRLMDPELFEKAGEELRRRQEADTRIRFRKSVPINPIRMDFRINAAGASYDDPFRQAAYTYSMIESEEEK